MPARDVSMDGALVYVCQKDSEDVHWLRKRGLPLVTIDQEVMDDAPSVNVDDASGAEAAAQHLLDLGHRRIGLLNLRPTGHADAGPDDVETLANPPAAERNRGWRRALTAAGVEPARRRWRRSAPRRRRTTQRSRCSTGPTARPALLCFSDAYAAQAIRAAESLGLRVPEDLSVVGFDDSALAATVRPALTTVRQPVAEKGTARRARPARPDGRRAAATRSGWCCPTELVVRDSTGPAPA